MYLGTATLRRFEAEGCKSEDLPFVHWAMQYAFAEIQQAMNGIFSNLPVPVLGTLFRGPVAWWWRMNPMSTLPADQLGSQIARSLQTPGLQRDRLTTGIYISSTQSEALGGLESAFVLTSQAEPVLKTIKAASYAGKLPQEKPELLIAAALEAKLITSEEAELMREAEAARNNAIQVDAFTVLEYLSVRHQSVSRGRE